MALSGFPTRDFNIRDIQRSFRQLFRRSFLSLKPTYPGVGLEITESHIVLARLERQNEGKAILQYVAKESLPPGAVELSLMQPNIRDLPVFTDCCREVLNQGGLPGDGISVALPDPIFRTAILDLESIPEERSEVHDLVTWKLRDSTPFKIADAVISYSRIGTMNKLLVSLLSKEVLQQYEDVFEGLGLHAGLVDQASFNCVNLLFEGGEPEAGILFLNVEERYFTIQILENGYLLFYRCKHFPQKRAGEMLAQELRTTLIFSQERLQTVHPVKHLYLRDGSRNREELYRLVEEELDLTLHNLKLDRCVHWDAAGELERDDQDALIPAVGVALGR